MLIMESRSDAGVFVQVFSICMVNQQPQTIGWDRRNVYCKNNSVLMNSQMTLRELASRANITCAGHVSLNIVYGDDQ